MKKLARNIACIALAFVLVLGAVPIAHAAHPFRDVPANAWYSSSVDYVYNHKLMNGTTTTQFSPDQVMTRGMLVAVIHRIAGSPAPNGKSPFRDVPANYYYAGPVNWCYSNGIVNGTTATTFAPDSYVSREQMVTIMHRFAKFSHADSGKRANLSRYSDQSRISPYARDSFSWAVANGIIKGTTPTTLSPQNGTTRSECSIVLQRYDQMMDNKPVPPAPTEPKPTEPKPTEPKPTEPTVPHMTSPVDKSYPYVDKNEGIKREISKWAMYYINEYRKEEGHAVAQPLNGLNLVAEYRADQLTVRYGHNTNDEREAAAYYKYGNYVDFSGIPGCSESDNYYEIEAEAIANMGEYNFQTTAKHIGKEIAETFRNSPNHWLYVGNKQPGFNYAYIGVGVEFNENGSMYCCVSLSCTNYDKGWVNPHP